MEVAKVKKTGALDESVEPIKVKHLLDCVSYWLIDVRGSHGKKTLKESTVSIIVNLL